MHKTREQEETSASEIDERTLCLYNDSIVFASCHHNVSFSFVFLTLPPLHHSVISYLCVYVSELAVAQYILRTCTARSLDSFFWLQIVVEFTLNFGSNIKYIS